jgi:hypothetical protein
LPERLNAHEIEMIAGNRLGAVIDHQDEGGRQADQAEKAEQKTYHDTRGLTDVAECEGLPRSGLSFNHANAKGCHSLELSPSVPLGSGPRAGAARDRSKNVFKIIGRPQPADLHRPGSPAIP